jgi:predicted AAA+ superfamily ATPase
MAEARQAIPPKWFSQYLKIGGFPEAQSLEASFRINLLQGYVDTVLFRDVIERYQLRQIAALAGKALLSQPCGQLISASPLSGS